MDTEERNKRPGTATESRSRRDEHRPWWLDTPADNGLPVECRQRTAPRDTRRSPYPVFFLATATLTPMGIVDIACIARTKNRRYENGVSARNRETFRNRPGNYSRAVGVVTAMGCVFRKTPSIHPCRLDGSIPAADVSSRNSPWRRLHSVGDHGRVVTRPDRCLPRRPRPGRRCEHPGSIPAMNRHNAGAVKKRPSNRGWKAAPVYYCQSIYCVMRSCENAVPAGPDRVTPSYRVPAQIDPRHPPTGLRSPATRRFRRPTQRSWPRT